MPETTKAIVSVSEMARMVGLSRQRFYQLQGTTFPAPLRDENGRPFYDEKLQEVCLEVRRRNCGVDGKAVMFYARRRAATPRSVVRTTATAKQPNNRVELVSGMTALGLTPVSSSRVDAALLELFPSGTAGVPDGEVLRAVFLHLRASESNR